MGVLREQESREGSIESIINIRLTAAAGCRVRQGRPVWVCWLIPPWHIRIECLVPDLRRPIRRSGRGGRGVHRGKQVVCVETDPITCAETKDKRQRER
jgi:hypothetical protein